MKSLKTSETLTRNNGLPLSGKTFISTGSLEKTDKFHLLLEHKGARVIDMPLISIEKATATKEVKFMQKNISDFDWVFFTSGYSIQFFFEFMSISGLSENKRLKYAVIGKASRDILRSYNIEADYVCDASGAISMARGFLQNIHEKRLNILIPSGDRSDGAAGKILCSEHNIYPVRVYRTLLEMNPEKRGMQAISSGNYDMIFFMSPSAFQNFLNVCHPEINAAHYHIGCLGPTTARAVSLSGFKPDFVGPGKGIDELVCQLEEFYLI